MTEACTKTIEINSRELNSVSREISKVFNSLLSKDNFFNLSDNNVLLPVLFSDATRIFAETFQGHAAFRNLVLSSLISIDRISPACSIIYLSTLQKVLSDSSLHKRPVKPFRVSSNEMLSLRKGSHVTGLGNDTDREIISAIKEAGALGTLRITCSDSTVKTVSNGCEFCIEFPAGFYSEMGKSQLTSPKVVIFEGSITEVSQIHHILEAASSSSSSLLIVCTGFSNEVAYTLAKNLELKKLKVIPVVIPDGIDSINDFHDLCFLLECMPVGPSNGTSLSSVNLHELPSVESAEILFDDQKMLLRTSNKRVMNLKKLISSQIAEEELQDRKDVLSKRLNRLMNNVVSLQIKADKCIEGIIQDRVSFFISNLTATAREGAAKSRDFISADFQKLLPRYVPYFSAINAVDRALSDSRFIFNTGMIIAVENE